MLHYREKAYGFAMILVYVTRVSNDKNNQADDV
jgi:hypothetical protein